MTNVYLEKVAKMVEKQPGVRHEVGTPNFFIDRSVAEEWRKPKDDEHKAAGRKVIGALGAISFAAPPLAARSLTGTIIGAGLGGLVGMGIGHLMANAGNDQDREAALLREARNQIHLRYDRELSYAKRNGYKPQPNVTME